MGISGLRVCPFLVQLHKYPLDGANRGSGLRTSCLERRSWPIAPLGISSLDGQVVMNFKFPQGETITITPSRALTGRKPGGSFSLSVSTPRRLHTLQSFCVILHIVQTCFPSFLTMPYLILHVSLNYPGDVIASSLYSHMFSCVFEIVEIL